MDILRAIAEAKREELEDEAKQKAANEMKVDPDRAHPILDAALHAWDKPCPFKRGDIISRAPHSSLWKSDVGHAIVVRTFPTMEMPMPINGSLCVVSYDMHILFIEDNGCCTEYRAHSRDFDLVRDAADAGTAAL